MMINSTLDSRMRLHFIAMQQVGQPLRSPGSDAQTVSSDDDDVVIIEPKFMNKPISDYFKRIPRRGRPSGSGRQSSRAGRPRSAPALTEVESAADQAAERLRASSQHAKPKPRRFVVPRETYEVGSPQYIRLRDALDGWAAETKNEKKKKGAMRSYCGMVEIHAHAYMHTHTCMHTCTCIHAYMHACIHAYTHIRMHAYIHAAYTYAYA